MTIDAQGIIMLSWVILYVAGSAGHHSQVIIRPLAPVQRVAVTICAEARIMIYRRLGQMTGFTFCNTPMAKAYGCPVLFRRCVAVHTIPREMAWVILCGRGLVAVLASGCCPGIGVIYMAIFAFGLAVGTNQGKDAVVHCCWGMAGLAG